MKYQNFNKKVSIKKFAKVFTIVLFVMFTATMVMGDSTITGNLIFDGANSWILHTPDDGRESLYFGYMQKNGGWTWPIEFVANGRSIFNSTMEVKGDSVVTGNLIFDGANSWILHTPDDGRESLYFGYMQKNGGWTWPIEFKSNGETRFNGTVTASSYACSSDARYKKNITPISDALQKLMSMNGMYYNWKKEEFKDKNFSSGRQIGFVAQDVEKVLPELVYTDEDGFKSMSYDKMTAVLVEAVKEMKIKNDIKISSLEKENALLKVKLASLEKLNDRLAKIEKMMEKNKIAKN